MTPEEQYEKARDEELNRMYGVPPRAVTDGVKASKFADGADWSREYTKKEYEKKIRVLREGLRKAVIWAQCISNRVNDRRDEINWTSLREAEAILKRTEE